MERLKQNLDVKAVTPHFFKISPSQALEEITD